MTAIPSLKESKYNLTRSETLIWIHKSTTLLEVQPYSGFKIQFPINISTPMPGRLQLGESPLVHHLTPSRIDDTCKTKFNKILSLVFELLLLYECMGHNNDISCKEDVIARTPLPSLGDLIFVKQQQIISPYSSKTV